MSDKNNSLKNRIIEFLDEGQLCIAIVLDESKDKVLVLDEKGLRKSIQAKRIVVVHDSSSDKSQIDYYVSQIRENLDRVYGKIDIELLWEGLCMEDREFSIPELAEEYFAKPGPVEKSAVARKVLENRALFKQRGASFKPMSPERVEERKRREEKEEEDAKAGGIFVNWAKAVLDNDKDGLTVPDELKGQIESLEHFLYGTPNKKLEALLKLVHPDIAAHLTAFRLLVIAGRIEPSADLALVRAGIREHFRTEAEDEAMIACSNSVFGERQDFTALYTFAIDDEGTEEIDDAFSVEKAGPVTRVFVHIADVAHFVGKGSLLDTEARNRSTTLYLPDRRVTMIPYCVSCDAASLKPGEIRPSMSFVFDFDENYSVINSSIVKGMVRINDHIDYTAADSPPPRAEWSEKLEPLFEIADKLKGIRLSRGAVTVDKPELKVKVAGDDIVLKLIPFRSRSRAMVGEFMILANSFAADFAVRNRIGAIFRTQEKPDSPVGDIIPDSQGDFDPVKTDELMRHMKPAKLSLYAEPHFSMGLDAYIQLTSPIRRYSDLVLQRQFTAHLAGEELPYDGQELLRVMAIAENMEKDKKAIEGDRLRFWVTRYFEKCPTDREFTAAIIRERTAGYIAELTDYAYRVFIRTPEKLTPGTRVTAKIAEADAEGGKLSFSLT